MTDGTHRQKGLGFQNDLCLLLAVRLQQEHTIIQLSHIPVPVTAPIAF
jgi:hypothetical protein